MSDEGLAPGKRLSEIRQQQGLSQRRAAELKGVRQTVIARRLARQTTGTA